MARTGAQLLAVAVGNVHGRYQGEPELRWDVLQDIAVRTRIPLVLHGASGIPAEELVKAAAMNVGKVNFNTELRTGVLATLEARTGPHRTRRREPPGTARRMGRLGRDFRRRRWPPSPGNSTQRSETGEARIRNMILASLVFAFVAALLHVYIFVMESVTWTRPATWKRFGVASQADADTTRPLAYNQGFYNLFLAAGALVGAGAMPSGTLRSAGLWSSAVADPCSWPRSFSP